MGLAVVLLSACGRQNLPTQQHDLPTLASIQSRLHDPLEGYPDGAPGQRLRCHVIAVPLDVSLEPLWQETSSSDLVVDLEQWHANGLQAGLLRKTHARTLRRVLENAVAVRTTRVVAAGGFVGIRTAAAIRQPAELTWMGSEQQKLHLRRGRLRWLLRLERTETQTTLQVVPHHHIKKSTVAPRSPRETALDGRIFHELTLTTPLRKGDLLLLGLFPPLFVVPPSGGPSLATGREPSSIEGDRSEPSQSDPVKRATNPGDQHAAPVPEPQPQPQPRASAPLPMHLGRYLFTAEQMGQPVQMLLVIGLDQP